MTTYLVATLWLCAVIVCAASLFGHAYRPGKVPDAASSAVTVAPADNYRLIVFAHPFCPCTRATIQELAESLTRLPEQPAAQVIYVTAGLDDASLTRAALEKQTNISGVEVLVDERGEMARTFGATISGEVFAFSPAGQLVFHGGLTPARGHQGESAGQEQLEQALQGKIIRVATSPIYGCPLPTEPSASH